MHILCTFIRLAYRKSCASFEKHQSDYMASIQEVMCLV